MIREEKWNEDDCITMWTVQTKAVIETLNRDGISYVKKRYITEKYGDTAWIFHEAYGFFTEKAKQIVEQPEEAESPVWMFADKKWAVPSQGSYSLKLHIPKTEIILFDLRFWSKVLNLSYLGTEEQEAEFEQKLTKIGIKHTMDAFSKPYYPQLKSEVKKSWNRLFLEDCREFQYVQGATWCIKKEWVENL